jgi:hypothetical protein
MALDEFEAQNLAQQMAGELEVRVANYGYSLDPSAREQLHGIVTNGVLRVRRSQGPLPRDVSYMEASIARLAGELIKESLARRDSENLIDESVISAVMAKLCPGFWPFC